MKEINTTLEIVDWWDEGVDENILKNNKKWVSCKSEIEFLERFLIDYSEFTTLSAVIKIKNRIKQLKGKK